MKILIGFTLLTAAACFGQGRYSATTGDVVLSGAGTKFTVQQIAAPTKVILLEAVVVYCSVACDLTQTQNGTAATSTAGTANKVLPFGNAATATVWTTSNVGSGTVAGGILHLIDGERVTLDLGKISLGYTDTATNYTFVVSSITGTANVTVYWAEK